MNKDTIAKVKQGHSYQGQEYDQSQGHQCQHDKTTMAEAAKAKPT
jgi:hypothetical protein